MPDTPYGITTEPATAGDGGALIATLRLHGEFDMAACPDLSLALHATITSGSCTRVVVDLELVEFIDSETVRVLLDGYHQAARHGLHYRLAHLHGLPRDVLDATGLTPILAPEDPNQEYRQTAD